MHAPKRYFHDRLVLLLLTVSAFLTVLTVTLIVLKLGEGKSEVYITQFRPILEHNAYQKGEATGILSFAVFSVLVFVFHFVLSVKVYSIRRNFGLIVLGLGFLLITLSLVISNALLLI